MTGKKHGLDEAYSIEGPDDARRLYADWAQTYDEGFVKEKGYASARQVASIFRERYAGGGPVLDVGAGTGEVARYLDGFTVDGIDISPEMLAEAKRKGLYRNRVVADLTKPLPCLDGFYHGVVSAGTLTHGHVGPICLPELLRVTAPGALFVCSVVPAVYDGAGFGSALALLVAKGEISPVRFHDIAIYEGKSHEHSDDHALIMEFERS